MNRLRMLWLLARRQGRAGLLAAAVAATVLVIVTSWPAHAAPDDPTPSPSSTTQPAPSGGPDGNKDAAPRQDRADSDAAESALDDFWDQQSKTLPKAAQQDQLRKQRKLVEQQLKDEGGVLGVFNVTDEHGIPVSTYNVSGDTGSWYEWKLGVWDMLTVLCFMVTKWLIAFACWLIAWALSFGLAKILLKPVLAIAQSLHSRVILELGLPSLFLAACAVICAWNIFFGDRARGWGDAALSIMIAALTAAAVIAPPQQLLGGADGGAVGQVRQFSLEVASIILDSTDPPDEQDDDAPVTAASLARPVTDALTDAFVAKPAQLIKYGRTFSGDCNDLYAQSLLDQLAWDRQAQKRVDKAKTIVSGVATGAMPGGGLVPGSEIAGDIVGGLTQLGANWAKNQYGDQPMKNFEAECIPGDAGAAKRASSDKVIGAFLVMIAALIVVLLIIAIAGSFLVAQYRIAYDAIRGEPALIAGTVPGAGRAYLWSWCSSVIRSLLQIATSVALLAIFIVMVDALLDVPPDEFGSGGLTVRFLAVDIVCIGAWRKRKELSRKSRDIGTNIHSRLSGARIGGTGRSILTTPPSPTAPPTARGTAGTIARTALVAGALATGNLPGAASRALRRDGTAALAARLGSAGRRTRRPAARPAPRPTTRRTTQRPPQAPASGPRRTPPRPGVPPRPTVPPQPASPPRRPRPAQRVPLQPPSSARQAQLRHRLDRRDLPRPPRRRTP